MNGFESLFSIPVIGLAAWWLIQRMFKKAMERIENSVSEKDFATHRKEVWEKLDNLIEKTARLEGGNNLARDIAEELRRSR